MKKLMLFLFVVLVVQTVWGQDSYNDFHEKSTAVNRTGMYILGGWAVANIASGAAGWSLTGGSAMRFYQMNLFWNTVNLGIAGFALYTGLNNSGSFMSADEMMQQHLKLEKLYLVNAGLDLIYISAGFYLRHLSTQKPNRHDLFLGYGNSVILQGSFLLIFDAVMWGIQQTNRLEFLQNINVSFVPETATINVGLVLPL